MVIWMVSILAGIDLKRMKRQCVSCIEYSQKLDDVQMVAQHHWSCAHLVGNRRDAVLNFVNDGRRTHKHAREAGQHQEPMVTQLYATHPRGFSEQWLLVVLLVLPLRAWLLVFHLGGEAGQLPAKTAAAAHFADLQKWSNVIGIAYLNLLSGPGAVTRRQSMVQDCT